MDEAAASIQPALSSADDWADNHYMTINLKPGKTEALCISLDPRETKGKATPYVHMNNTMIGYNKNPEFLGITFDAQLIWILKKHPSDETRLRK